MPIPDLQLSRVAHAATISAEFAHGARVDLQEGMRSRCTVLRIHAVHASMLDVRSMLRLVGAHAVARC